MEILRIDLSGGNYVVLAGSKGLGFASVKAIVESGGNVFFCSRDPANVREAMKKLGFRDNIHGTICDLTDEASLVGFFNKAYAEMGPLDGMVYNTGGPPAGRFDELDLGDWDYSYKLLIRSAVIATRMFIRASKEGGAVVYIASIAVKEPVENLVLSNSLRMAILGLSKTLSRELGGRIRFNVVLPGYIFTDRIRNLVSKRSRETGKPAEKIIEEMVREVPLGRIGRPEEVGGVVAFLLSSFSSYINGAVIPVDGGLHKGSF